MNDHRLLPRVRGTGTPSMTFHLRNTNEWRRSGTKWVRRDHDQVCNRRDAGDPVLRLPQFGRGAEGGVEGAAEHARSRSQHASRQHHLCRSSKGGAGEPLDERAGGVHPPAEGRLFAWRRASPRRRAALRRAAMRAAKARAARVRRDAGLGRAAAAGRAAQAAGPAARAAGPAAGRRAGPSRRGADLHRAAASRRSSARCDKLLRSLRF